MTSLQITVFLFFQGICYIQAQDLTYKNYVFQDLTYSVQWKGAVATACVIVFIFLVVLTRDCIGCFDFGTIRKTMPVEQGLTRALTITSAGYAVPPGAALTTVSTDSKVHQNGPEIMLQPIAPTQATAIFASPQSPEVSRPHNASDQPILTGSA